VSATRPNILVFMTDQQLGETVLPGSPRKAPTPALDTFRRDAVTFGRAFCPSPHCCPSRATFLTGLMPSQHGVWNNVCVTNALSRGLRPRVRPWSLDLREAGYRMLFAGKWHASNFQEPAEFGWEHVFPGQMCHGTGKDAEDQRAQARARELKWLEECADRGAASPLSGRRPGEIPRPGQTPYVHYGTVSDPWLARYFRNGDRNDPFGDRTVVDAALAALDPLLDNAGSEPWCTFIGTLGPHDPYIPPQEFLDACRDLPLRLPDSFDDPMDDKPGLYRRTRDVFATLSREEHLEALRHYLAFCAYEDQLFGRIIDRLRQAGRYEDTLVVYLSDHGDYAGDHGLWCKGLPSFTSAYHIPAVVKLPGTAGPRGTMHDQLVSLADFAPTLLEAAGVPSRTRFAGRSLQPLLRENKPPTLWRDALFFQSDGNETYGIQRSILTDEWRFVHNGFDYDELYNLREDPQQIRNLARDPATREIRAGLYRRLWEFALAHDDHLTNDYILTALAEFGPGLALGER
jgi:arylsulfatase A-like enzyme